MHHKVLTSVALFSTIAIVCAQDLSALPPCALDAITAAVGSSGCPQTDTACICASSAFTSLGSSLTSVCSASDVNLAIAAGQQICAAAQPSVSSSNTAPESSPTPQVPGEDPVATEDDSYNVSTTTVPGTVTSTSIVPGATEQDMTDTHSISTMHPNSTYSASTLTGTITEHASPSGTAMTSTTSRHSSYTGLAASERAHGFVVVAIGIVGALALL